MPAPACVLPEPAPDARARSAVLAEKIRRAIHESGGAIPFAQFMQMALYEPGLGYYSAGARKLGAGGDFITAPEISPLFGRCLARQCAQVLEKITPPASGSMLEFGAGSGKLAAEILLHLAARECLPQHYFILEVSADLRERQRATLRQLPSPLAERVRWLESLPELFTGVVIANEVLDAMPCERFTVNARGEFERLCVTHEPEGFHWHSRAVPVDDPLAGALRALTAAGLEFAAGYQSEINLLHAGWLRALAAGLRRGVILLLDYGYPRGEYYHPQRHRGSLRCHYRQRAHEDAFMYPGLQDITAHVDFTALAEAAQQCGFTVAGFTTQANFLLALGLAELYAQACASADTATRTQLAAQVKTLTLPGEMGEVFKVLALTKNVDDPLAGYSLANQLQRL